MNWLAHIYLSEPSPAFRIGSVLPDLVSKAELIGLDEEFQKGIRRHYRIDAFTDAHPVVRRSIGRLHPSYRRFGGIIIDVFYDHFLARRWEALSKVSLSLEDFAEVFHSDIDSQTEFIPPAATARLEGIRAEKLLCSYRDIGGIQSALARTGKRFRRPVPLGLAIAELEQKREALEEDFSEFFPELQAFVLGATTDSPDSSAAQE